MYSDPVTNVVTSPSQDKGVILIVLRHDEGYRLLGSPSVHYLTRFKRKFNLGVETRLCLDLIKHMSGARQTNE